MSLFRLPTGHEMKHVDALCGLAFFFAFLTTELNTARCEERAACRRINHLDQSRLFMRNQVSITLKQIKSNIHLTHVEVNFLHTNTRWSQSLRASKGTPLPLKLTDVNVEIATSEAVPMDKICQSVSMVLGATPVDSSGLFGYVPVPPVKTQYQINLFISINVIKLQS